MSPQYYSPKHDELIQSVRMKSGPNLRLLLCKVDEGRKCGFEFLQHVLRS